MNKIIRDVPYPAIDGIRFYAAFAVLVQHSIGSAVLEYLRIPAAEFTTLSTNRWMQFWAYIADGNHGVDVFFLISGFLMARIVLSGRPFNYASFIWSRARRIYPAFLASLVLSAAITCLVFGWTWSPAEFAKNLLFLNAVPGLVTYPYNHVTWSLGYEFAFYLVIPAYLIFAKFIDKRVVAVVAVIVCYFYMPQTYIRMIGLFVGAVIGTFSDDQLKRFAARIPLIPTFTAFVGLGLGKAFFGLSYLAYYYPFLAAGALLLIKITWDSQNELHRFFAQSWMRWLGTLSYSIYLYHSLVASLVLKYLVPPQPTLLGILWFGTATLALTIGISYLSYVLIEQRYFAGKTHKQVKAPVIKTLTPEPERS